VSRALRDARDKGAVPEETSKTMERWKRQKGGRERERGREGES
jgi:hypothetical protein